MSSKLRMQVRIKRLQDIYKSLGKDPNSKEIEIKSLAHDFDKVARKFIAKVKKGKNEILYSRYQILIRYGLRSSQRMTIDEETTTLIKGMDHDFKRLRTILGSYKDKKGDDLNEKELAERKKVAEIVQECQGMFQ